MGEITKTEWAWCGQSKECVSYPSNKQVSASNTPYFLIFPVTSERQHRIRHIFWFSPVTSKCQHRKCHISWFSPVTSKCQHRKGHISWLFPGDKQVLASSVPPRWVSEPWLCQLGLASPFPVFSVLFIYEVVCECVGVGAYDVFVMSK